MFFNKTPDPTHGLVDGAALSAEQAILATRRVADDALDGLVDTVHDARDRAAPLLTRASEQANAAAQRTAAALHRRSQQVRDRAARASDSTLGYIRAEPVKAVLMAAATGAALVALLSLLGRSTPRA